MKFNLIVGLGNPGPSYARTYHNVGFLALDSLIARSHTNPVWKLSRSQLFTYAHVKSARNIFVKPNVFMNVSGLAVEEALRQFKVPLQRLVVLHDETDLPIGTVRASTGRGSAGHRGVASIIESVRSKTFHRIRIGIRNEVGGRQPAKALVLKRITAADDALLQLAFEEVGALLEKLIEKAHA